MSLIDTPRGDQVARHIGRPPEQPYGRVFRLDVAPTAGDRLAYADGVVAPDGTALARIRDTGVVVTAPRGIEDLVATLGDPRIRVVYRTDPGTI